MAKKRNRTRSPQPSVTGQPQDTAPENETVDETAEGDDGSEEGDDTVSDENAQQPETATETAGEASETQTPAAAPESTDTASSATEETKTEEAAAPTSTPATQETPAPAEAADKTPVAEVIEDDQTKKADPKVPEATIAPVVQPLDEPVVEAAPSATAPAEGDSDLVGRMKILLEAFKRSANTHGNQPEDFNGAARLTSTITKFVITNPKVEVLETMLSFFVENKDGCCAMEHYLKGSTSVLDSTEQQQVGYLYNLMNDIANGHIVGVNQAHVVQVLKKPEIASWWQRKVAALRAAAGK